MYILFYSNKCKYCESMIDILKTKNYIRFKLICIDDNKNLPPYLTKVPTLLFQMLINP